MYLSCWGRPHAQRLCPFTLLPEAHSLTLTGRKYTVNLKDRKLGLRALCACDWEGKECERQLQEWRQRVVQGKCPKGIFWTSKLPYRFTSPNIIHQELPISQALCYAFETSLSINSIYLVNLILGLKSDKWQIVMFRADGLGTLSCVLFLSSSKACLISKSPRCDWGSLWWKTQPQNVKFHQFLHHKVHYLRVNLSDKQLVPWKFIFYL